MNTSSRKILIITYYYPPINVPGALRPMSFAKYLPDFGYDVHILTTARHGSVSNEDSSIIHRALEPYGYLIAPFRNMLMRSVPSEKRSTARVLTSESMLARIQNRLMIPDQAITWVPFARRLAAKLLRDTHFDVIFSTSPPESTHLVAQYIREKYKIPWVADFRDGWLFEPLKRPECYQGLQGKLMSHLEGRVVRQADGIVGVTPPIGRDFQVRYPDIANKVHVLTNGYDGEEVSRMKRLRGDDDTFWIVYTGSLAMSRPDRSVKSFYTAVSNLVKSNEAGIANHIKVSFVGDFSMQEKNDVSLMGLDKWIEFVNRVERFQALQFQADADVLLLITEPGRKGVATAKLFDYIGMKHPILALAKGDTAGQIVDELHIGRVVGTQDIQGISAAITDMYRMWQSGNLRLDAPPPAEYERKHQAGLLANIFDSLIRRVPSVSAQKGKQH